MLNQQYNSERENKSQDQGSERYKKDDYNKNNNNYYSENHSEISELIESAVNETIPLPFREPKLDLTRNLENIAFNVAQSKPYSLQHAKTHFEKYFFETQFRNNYGNIAKVARETGVDRRTVHRKVNQLNLNSTVDMYRPQKQQEKKSLDYQMQTNLFSENYVAESIKKTLDNYKASLNPSVYNVIGERVNDYAKQLTSKLNNQNYGITRDEKITAIYSGINTNNFKQAEKQFEKEFIYQTLKETKFDKQKTADYLNVSTKTLDRKINEHNLRENNINSENSLNNLAVFEQYYNAGAKEKKSVEEETQKSRPDSAETANKSANGLSNVIDIKSAVNIRNKKLNSKTTNSQTAETKSERSNQSKSDVDRLREMLKAA